MVVLEGGVEGSRFPLGGGGGGGGGGGNEEGKERRDPILGVFFKLETFGVSI